MEDNLGCPPQEHRLPLLRQGLSLTWNSPIKLDLLSSKAKGSSCLLIPGAEVTSVSPFHVGYEGFNSGVPTCEANALLTELTP